MVNFDFTTKCIKYKRNGVTVLSHYPELRLIRKMTKSEHILRRPLGLTIDANFYDQLKSEADLIYFEISDGRAYTITTALLDKTALVIDRAGRGRQYVAHLKDLTQVKPEPEAQTKWRNSEPAENTERQLSLFGGN